MIFFSITSIFPDFFVIYDLFDFILIFFQFAAFFPFFLKIFLFFR